MPDSIYLRMASSVQSWAGPRVTGNVVRTEAHPTRSGLEGLVAGAFGWNRNKLLDWISEVDFTVRTDRPGIRIDEFQTINPRDEDLAYQKRAFLLSTGKKWSKRVHFTPDGQNKTSIVNRTYLADAEFLIEVSHPTKLDEINSALRFPVFTTYLGRKAFAPGFPFYLGTGERGALTHLPTTERTIGPSQFYSEYFEEGPTSSTIQLRVDALPPSSSVSTDKQITADSFKSVSFVDVEAVPREAWLETVANRFTR